jgi:hypothetical protein
MARIPDALIDDRAAKAPACDEVSRATARPLDPLAGMP